MDDSWKGRVEKFKEDYPHLSDLSLMEMMLRICHVPRWGVIPMGRPQSVAEHSFRVAGIAIELARRIVPDMHQSKINEIAFEAMTHDCDEAVSNDIPAPYKGLLGLNGEPARAILPALPQKSLDLNVRWLVKMADMIEARTYLTMWGRSVDGVDVRLVKHANMDQHVLPRLAECPFKDRKRAEDAVWAICNEICGE